MYTQGDWTSKKGAPFASSEEAYNSLHIGDPAAARKIQADGKDDASKNSTSPKHQQRDLTKVFEHPAQVVTVIGRGHSGTRAMSHTLTEAGVFMGEPLNKSGDLLPPADMYEACRVIATHVKYLGDLRWDFSKLHTMKIDPAFTRLIDSYLSSVIDAKSEWRGWKIPETTLCYPWIVRLFPDIRYIHWVRDPRDCILGKHLTDDLSNFGVPTPDVDDPLEQRAVSWLYQAQMMRDTPKPKHVIEVRFEDFVLDQPNVRAFVEVSGH